MKKSLTIVKVGGGVIEDEESLASFLDAFVQVEGKKILVHGGGKIATKLAADLGVKAQMVEGRRITDDQMIDVVIMTYGGLLNKKLVAGLNARGATSIGLSGADGNVILSSKRPLTNGIDYGWVGDIKSVNAVFLTQLLNATSLPVMAPLTYDRKGHLLNTNADTIASEIAIALSKSFDVNLNFIFDQKGVMKDLSDPKSLIRSIDFSTYKKLKAEKIIVDGMIPKLDNAFYTINKGVSEVRLLNVNALSNLQKEDFDEYTRIH